MTAFSNNIYKYSFILFISIVLPACSGTTRLKSNNPNSISTSIDLDTVRAQRFDMGKMWTFDDPPVEYFSEAYSFEPDEKWFENVRKSALRFSSYCSASFVSEDGLIMTNHHCGRESVIDVSKEGEDLAENGFFAETPDDERKVNGLYVDQLVIIKDVTDEINNAGSAGTNDEEKRNLIDLKIEELRDSYKKETGLIINVVSFYNGSRYSVYGYKRYRDVRLVFAPENALGFFGGDYDNFTYPRYCLDYTFFRVYEDNKPLKTENYYRWSPKGISEGEPVFVVGNPGSTNRLKTVAQLEYMRDLQYPKMLNTMNGLVEVYLNLISQRPEEKSELESKLYRYTNSQKVYKGMIEGLNDPVLMARKRDFENKFKNAVRSKSELKAKYGHLWKEIEDNNNSLREITPELNAYQLNYYFTSDYFYIARDLIVLASQLNLPESKRYHELTNKSSIDSLIAEIFPKDFDKEQNKQLLKIHIDNIIYNLGKENELVQTLFGNREGMEAAEYILSKSKITSKEQVIELAQQGSNSILHSGDPFINFILYTESRLPELLAKSRELKNREEGYNQLLGQALYGAYGNSIPPDATFTLRISDGVVKGYEYNGTVAPARTTFLGLYDRYFSFGKKFPWDLPERWQNPPAEFDLESPMNFVSTNDITGGSSGSPVINKNAEIVGLSFDGNIESLPGDFIYETVRNRSISVDAEGIMESIQDLYNADRLSEELKSGKIPEQYNVVEENADTSVK